MFPENLCPVSNLLHGFERYRVQIPQVGVFADMKILQNFERIVSDLHRLW